MRWRNGEQTIRYLTTLYWKHISHLTEQEIERMVHEHPVLGRQRQAQGEDGADRGGTDLRGGMNGEIDLGKANRRQ